MLRRNRLPAAPALPPDITTTLAVLDLSRNAICDLTPLTAQPPPALRALLLSRNRIADLAPLQVRRLGAAADSCCPYRAAHADLI